MASKVLYILQGEMKFEMSLALQASCKFILLAQVSEELAQRIMEHR